MQKVFAYNFYVTIGRKAENFSLGLIWGAVAGAIIGGGISMTIGLFYSSATYMIFSVIIVSSILGAIFGQIMSGLLADDIVLTGHQPETHAIVGHGEAKVVNDLCEHKILKSEIKDKITKNQDVMSVIHAMRSRQATLPPYPNAQVFELIVMEAQKTKVSLGKTGIGMEGLS